MSEWNGADYQKLSVANGMLRNLRSTIGKQAYEIKRLRSREAKLLRVVGKLKAGLEKISGTDEIFEKEEFILCACEESHAYMQMNKRRRNAAREALASVSEGE